MIVEIVDTLLEIFGDRIGRFEVGVVERGLFQHEKPGLDEVEPRGIGWRPEELDAGRGGRPKVERSFVCAEVVPNKVDLAVCSEVRQHGFLQKREHDFAGFVGTGNSDSLASVGRKGRQELDGSGSMIAIRTARRSVSPNSAAAWNAGEWAHFVRAHHHSILRRVAI